MKEENGVLVVLVILAHRYYLFFNFYHNPDTLAHLFCLHP